MQLKLTQTTYAKMTGETPEVCSDKRKPRMLSKHQGHQCHQGLRVILETSNTLMGCVKIQKAGGGDHLY